MNSTEELTLRREGPSLQTTSFTAAPTGLALLAGLMLLFAAVTTVFVLALPSGGDANVAVTDTATVVAAAVAAVFAGLAAYRSSGRMRTAWEFIAAGLAVWAAAEITWTTYEIVLHQEVPLPSVADVGYLGAVPLILAGIVLLGSASRWLARARTVLDGVALVLAICVVVWHQVLLPIYSDSGATLMEKAIGGAYPVTDLMLFFGLAAALSRNRDGRGGAIVWMFSGGLAVMLSADIAYAYLSLSDGYVSGSVIDLGWIYGYLMMGYSAALCASRPMDVAVADESQKATPSWRPVVPLMLMATMFGQLLVVGFDAPLRSDVTSVVLSALVLSVVLARQAVVYVDNRRLNDSLLDARGELEKRVDQLKVANRKLTWMSRTDDLTGIANHRALMEAFDEKVKRSAARGEPMAIMMIDIDKFKLFNDTHGHPQGDRVLRHLARIMRKTFKKEDIVGRYGGDEFMAVMPRTDREAAIRRANRLLKAASSAGFHVRQGQPVPLAVSIGLAAYPEDSRQKEELLAYADASLYKAKQTSGNNIVVAHSTGEGGLFESPGRLGVLDALVMAVDRKDRYTRAHSQRNAEFAVELGNAIGLSDAGLSALRIAALLHDVGKIGIPDDILQKPGPLTENERAVMQEHVSLSNLIIHGVPNLQDVSDAVYCHHERWDGKGYPRGLKGKEIPLHGRIMAVIDAYSAMIMDRPYRTALSHEEAVAELRRCSGTQFDPTLVARFIDLITAERRAA